MKSRIIKIVFIILVLIKGSGACAQENKIIRGNVTTFGVIPLNNVEFTASKSGEVAHSDSLGLFSISCSEKDIIKISASGFDGIRIKARKFNQLFINLVYSNNQTSFANATENRHISKELLEMAIKKYPLKGEKDYSKYNNIYDLIDCEIFNVNVSGTSVTTTKRNSFSLSQEVLNVVDGIIVPDISFVVPYNVKSVKYVNGPEASKYGSRGANGAIEITLK